MKYLYLNKLLKIKNVVLTLIFSINIIACKKDQIKSPATASLTLVNAVVGGKSAKFGNAQTYIFNNDYTHLGLNTGEQNLYIWPYDDSLHPYFNYDKLNVQQGEAYSLFVFGMPGATDGILIKENIPYRTDSSTGIRFINLASNKPTLNVTLLTTPTVNEVTDLNYKQYTEFKSYAGNYNSSYVFQIRDASSQAPGSPLTTFSLPASSIPRFANITLVIKPNGTGVSVFRVNEDRL